MRERNEVRDAFTQVGVLYVFSLVGTWIQGVFHLSMPKFNRNVNAVSAPFHSYFTIKVV